MSIINDCIAIGKNLSELSSPCEISGYKLNNKLVFQPMEGFDSTIDGGISSLTERRYMRFAEGGAGLIWFEAVAVTKKARSNPNQLYLHDGNVEEFSKLLTRIKQRSMEAHGFAPVVIMQATHSGRHSRPIDAPAPIIAHHNEHFEKIKPLSNYIIASDEYLKKVEDCYEKTAMLAIKAGFDGVDVKCCHGYLFNEFMSAYNREGIYGGESIVNRSRLFINCIDRVRAVIGEKILATRLNAYDGFEYPYGFAVKQGMGTVPCLDETKYVINELVNRGVSLVNITIGNPYVCPSINRPHKGGNEDGEIGVERVATITSTLQKCFPAVKIILSAPTFLGVDSMPYAEGMLFNKNCALVGFGRMTFAYPMFYQDYLANGNINKKKCCIMCGKCSELMRLGSVTGCPIRDTLYTDIYKKKVLDK